MTPVSEFVMSLKKARILVNARAEEREMFWVSVLRVEIRVWVILVIVEVLVLKGLVFVVIAAVVVEVILFLVVFGKPLTLLPFSSLLPNKSMGSPNIPLPPIDLRLSPPSSSPTKNPICSPRSNIILPFASLRF